MNSMNNKTLFLIPNNLQPGHNVLRFCYVLPNFGFTASETKRDYW